jgi:CDP-diacylglycerol--glycerol-3-phosphate 3-phosphatidyltransferase
MALFPARGLARLGVTPNMLTVAGLLLNVVVALVIASGQPVLGGVLVLLANAFDMLDGAVARLTGTVSRFGAFFDSTLDRYAEAVMYLGVGVWLYETRDGSLLLACYGAIIGSLMVSYARARAEGIGVGGEVGLLPRPERIILLAVGLIFHGDMLAPVLWILAVFSNLTAVQRIVHVHRELAAKKQD